MGSGNMREIKIRPSWNNGQGHSELKPWLLILLFVAWLVPGLVGHDPWKPDEAYTFGLVNHVIKTGDWVVPTLAGEPFMEKPPLYYIVAAGVAKIFSPPLALHDAARLTTGFFMALTLFFTGLAGRELYGRNKGFLAALILIGCLGILIRAHELITDMAVLTGFSMALYGLALSLRRSILAGVLLGTGIGIGFMSKGLLEPGIIGVLALLLPVLFKAWRRRVYFICLLVALVAALPWLTIWPLALYLRSPVLFMEWFWTNNIGRFVGFTHLGPTAEHWGYVKMLPWYAWPALPLALWTLWHEGRAGGLRRPEIQFPLAAFLVIFSVLSIAHDARELYALPLLLPLTYLATASVDSLRRGAANALYWFGVMAFAFFGIVFWFYWIAVEYGVPADLSNHLKDLQPGYTPGVPAWVIIIAVCYTLGWIITLLRLKRSRERPIIVWSAGMTLIWGLLMTLFVSWLDVGKSYRSMVDSMVQSLPPHHACIASEHLGEPQRAMLEYYAGIITRRVEVTGSVTCPLLLIQGGSQDKNVSPGPSWKMIWEGNRPGDKNERYRLFEHAEPGKPAS